VTVIAYQLTFLTTYSNGIPMISNLSLISVGETTPV
jgi:hypothetical protein